MAQEGRSTIKFLARPTQGVRKASKGPLVESTRDLSGQSFTSADGTIESTLQEQKQLNPERVKDDLMTFIQRGDFSSITTYIKEHSNQIYNDIYLPEGVGSHYLYDPYAQVCFTNLPLALQYQELLESEIAGDVLFANE